MTNGGHPPTTKPEPTAPKSEGKPDPKPADKGADIKR